MSGAGTKCPSCASACVRLIGPIAPSNIFAGRMLEAELDGGNLWRCRDCGLVFRHPRTCKSDLDQLYRAGNEQGWQTPVDLRTDWRLIREWLVAQPQVRSVLDVGCFDGRLLEYLGRDYAWKGIEIHAEAARRARARGVDVVGTDFEHLSGNDAEVDAALAVDVIEHSFDPKAFLASMAACVRPGGFVVLTTGNTESRTWQLMGSRYWYCHIAEHMSFINPTWVKAVAPLLGLELVQLRLFSHSDTAASFKRRAYEASANLVLRFAPALFARLRRSGAGGIDLQRFPGLAHAPPYWMSARDHMLVVLRKGPVV